MNDKTGEKDWELISFVKRSGQRREVLEVLDNPSMPKEISEVTGIRQPHVSRALKELKEKSLVTILNPDAKRGRLYRRTDKGEEILKEVVYESGSPEVAKVRDERPEYSVVAEGAVLEEKTGGNEDPAYESLNEKVREVKESWKNGDLSDEEAIERYEEIREELEELERK